jgi:integrase
MGRQLIGQPLHPHQVRHGLATGMLKRDPRSTPVAAAALSHHSQGSVNQVYDRADPKIFAAVWRDVQRRRGFG